MRGHRAGQIDPMHQPAAEQRSERVGIIRQNFCLLSDCESLTGRGINMSSSFI